MSGASTIEVAGLSKHYRVRAPGGWKSFLAVDDVSFSVAEGECLAIVGESGSGKSTIAKLLIGMERASGGVMTVCGNDRSRPVANAAARRRRGSELQIVFQDPYTSLDPRQTARDSIEEILALHGRSTRAGRKARVREIAELIGMDERQLSALPGALSGGQRQRVAIAKALAASPRTIVLDEAVSALDVSIQAQVLNVLNTIRQETGVSYLFITHDLAVVRQIADRAIVLQRGHVVEAGTVEDILDHPSADYTRLLIDAVPRPGWKPPTTR